MEALHQVFIQQFMTRNPITLLATATVADAYEMMNLHHIRHVPVVDIEGRLKGIFSQTDLLRAYSPRETESGWYFDKEELAMLSLRHFMTADPAFLKENQSLSEAAKMMMRNKFSCVPIVSSTNGKLVGVITYVDLLREITKFFS